MTPPLKKFTSFNINALILSYTVYEFEAAPLLNQLSKNSARYLISHGSILNGFLKMYTPPSNSILKPNEIVAHLSDVAMPYYKKLAAGHLLINGEKDVIDHRGDMVHVTGTLYKGNLTGYGEYTDRAGNKWFAWFNNDLKHGICKFSYLS